MTAALEEQHLQDVQRALLKLLNDDTEAADAILKQQDSAYHHLGRGISGFIGAMLATEKEMLKEASATLIVAENKNWDDSRSFPWGWVGSLQSCHFQVGSGIRSSGIRWNSELTEANFVDVK